MPTTSVRHLISPLSRSIGLMEWIFGPVIFREAHEGEHIGLCFIHEGREFRHLRTQLIGDLAPLLAGGLGIVLNKGGADEGSDDTTALATSIGEHVAHEVNPGVVEEVCRGWLDATNGTAGRL
jgi:hypothetical protein